MAEKEVTKLLNRRQLKPDEADVLAEALSTSRANDAALLTTIAGSRRTRAISLWGTAVSVFLVAFSLGVLLYAALAEAPSAGIVEFPYADDPPETPAELDRLIEGQRQILSRPSSAPELLRLAAAYQKRYGNSASVDDLVNANRARERAQVLIRKNPKEVTMKINTAIFVITFAILIIGFVGLGIMLLYNGLVKRDEEVDARWAQIETVLQRRLDLVPQLVETVKGYAKHEQETLTKVIEARSQLSSALGSSGRKAPADKATIDRLSQASAGLGSALGKMMLLVEKYPDLKANQNFLALQDQLEGTENRIAVERRRYNESVKGLNARIRYFPYNAISGMFGFEPREYYQSEAGADEAYDVKF